MDTENAEETEGTEGTEGAEVDEQGFIRRWLLLEPIKQDIRSNTVFTDTWLRDVFTKTYFKNQMTMLH